MKAILLLTALLPLAATAATPADTVKTISNVHHVVVTEDSLGTHLNVVGTGADSTYHYAYDMRHTATGTVTTTQTEDHDISLRLPFSKTDTTRAKRSYWEIVIGGLYGNFGLGWMNVDKQSPDFDRLKGHEYEFGVLQLPGVNYNTGHGQRISLSLGIEWRHINLHNGGLLGKDDAGNVIIDPIPDGATKVKSSIELFSLQFPLLFTQSFAKEWEVFAGGIMNVNTGAHLSNSYKLGDVSHNDEVDGVKRRKVSFDVIGGIMWDDMGVYVRWRPQSVLQSGYLPKMSTLSVGLMLVF